MAIAITILYWQGDSSSWIRLRYGMAVAVYDTVDSPREGPSVQIFCILTEIECCLIYASVRYSK
jgi:hypothetical protein